MKVHLSSVAVTSLFPSSPIYPLTPISISVSVVNVLPRGSPRQTQQEDQALEHTLDTFPGDGSFHTFW